jgi:hypothetical protein
VVEAVKERAWITMEGSSGSRFVFGILADEDTSSRPNKEPMAAIRMGSPITTFELWNTRAASLHDLFDRQPPH